MYIIPIIIQVCKPLDIIQGFFVCLYPINVNTAEQFAKPKEMLVDSQSEKKIPLTIIFNFQDIFKIHEKNRKICEIIQCFVLLISCLKNKRRYNASIRRSLKEMFIFAVKN